MFLTLNVIGIGRKTGKTRLIERLCSALTKRNYRVSTIKHIFEGTFDTAHKDTWKHLQAGADPVIALSSKELITIARIHVPTLEQALNKIPDDVDLVLIEGFKESENPKIVVARTKDEAEALLNQTSNVIAISGPIIQQDPQIHTIKGTPILADQNLITLVEQQLLENIVQRLPQIDCKRCGYTSCTVMAEAIREGQASLTQCTTLSNNDVVLLVNRRPIHLGAFPKKFLKNTVLGMIKPLQGVETPRSIKVELTID